MNYLRAKNSALMRFLRCSARGGMGQVYCARDTTLHRNVALEVLPATFLRDPERMARFQREAQVLASLDHPNFVGKRASLAEVGRAPMIARLLILTAGLFHLCLAQTFDVASIRASQFQSGDGEGSGRESIQTSADGLTMRNVTLQSCISWAYSVQDFQIAGGLGADRFDIVAKAGAPANVPTLRAMLRTLLGERFKLKLHRDTKELSSLVLVVARGGLKLHNSQEDAPGVLRPDKGAMVVQHATMSEFIATLAGPLRTPLIDKTGLTGRYDFTVDLSSYLADAKPGQQPDMTGIMMSALREQLGLNLESRKESVEILVIDHAGKSPSGN